MHPKNDLLRALLDEELPAGRAGQVQEHLSRCPQCRQEFDRLRLRAEQVNRSLDVLAPPARFITPQQAYARFNHSHKTQKEINTPMTTRKPLWTALAVIAVLAIAFSLTPVRAWASDFLSLFRVQNITVIQFDPNEAEQVQDSLSANEAAIRQILDENLEVSENGEMVAVASVDEAAERAGFTPRLPALLADADLYVKPAINARLTIDQPKMQAIIDAVGADVQLAPELDSQVALINVPASVLATSGCSQDPDITAACKEMYQMPSPSVDAPEGLDMQKIGAAMLQLLGLTQQEADQLSRQIDWSSTLVLPIPTDANVQVSDMAVDGVNGTLMVSEEEGSFMLVWAKDGFVYGLRGPGGAAEAQELAGSLP